MSVKRTVLFIATASAFFTPFIGSATNIALPAIGAEYRMNAITLTWVATSYLLAAAVFLVPFGKLGDIYGRKKIFTAGMILFTLGSALVTLSPSSFWFIGLRVIQGAGSGMIFGTGVAILTSVYPPGERGRALGINVAAVYTGLAMGPTIGGILTQNMGWRSIFLFVVPFGVLIIFIIFLKLKHEWREAKDDTYDLPGAIVYSATIVSLMYGLSTITASNGLLFFILGIIGLVGFILLEIDRSTPLLDIRLFRSNVIYAFSNLAALINYSATFAVGFLLSLYLQLVKGFSPQKAGLILVAQPIIMAIFSPLAGRLSDKTEPRIIASTGMAITVLGLSALIFIGMQTTMVYIVGCLICLGVGFGLFSSPNTNAVMSSVHKRSYGIASATLGTMRLVGQMFSMGIASVLFAILIGKRQITPEYHAVFLKSLRVSFTIFASLCLLGVFASLGRGEMNNREQGEPISIK